MDILQFRAKPAENGGRQTVIFGGSFGVTE
jgi:hypothetical protein